MTRKSLQRAGKRKTRKGGASVASRRKSLQKGGRSRTRSKNQSGAGKRKKGSRRKGGSRGGSRRKGGSKDKKHSSWKKLREAMQRLNSAKRRSSRVKPFDRYSYKGPHEHSRRSSYRRPSETGHEWSTF
jgi:hypothetical protein